MKTKISHLGRSTVSVILAVMMILSTMLIGTISVNAADYFTVGDTLYLDISGASYTATDANAEFYIKFYKKGTQSFSWSKLSQIENSKVYSGTVPSGEWDHAVFTRVNGNAFNSGQNWDKSNIYSSADTTIADKGDNNCWSLNNGDMKGAWTTYSGGSGGGSTEATYYLGGRVGQNLKSDTWLGFTKDYEFQKTETSGLYKYVSKQTPAQWTQTIGNLKLKQYFFVHTGSNAEWYGSTQETRLASANQATTLKNYYNDNDTNTNRLLYIDSSDTSGNVTFWFDTRNSDKQLYYTVGSESSQTPVAQSVSLTASPETVTSGGSTKLTATLTNKATGVDKVTYTFKNADGTVVGTLENTDKDTASVDVNNITSDTTYTVTVSATDYSDVSDTAKVTVKQLENWYLIGSAFGGIWDTSYKQCKLDYDSATGFYYHNTTGAETGDVYFRFHDGNNQYCPDSDKKVIALAGEKLKITKSTNTYAFKYSNTVSNYRIWLDSSNASDIKVWITDITKKYNISNNSGKELIISPNQAGAGETVTVTATPGTGEVLQSVTVVGDDHTPVTTTVSGNTATFTMPSQDVTVTGVNFREAKTCKVTFRPSDEKYGEVTAQHNETAFATGNTVTEGDTVTFTAKPNSGYVLSNWTVNGESVSATNNPYTITVNKDTTVVANFVTGTPSGYYLLCGEDPTFQTGKYTPVPLYTNEEGVYYADFDATNITKKKDYYIIFSRKEDTSGIIVETNNVTINTVDNNGFSLGSRNDNVQNSNGGSNNVKFAKVYINSDDVTGFTIKITGLDLDKKKITYSAVPTFDVAPADTVEITAKDGTIRGTTATIAALGNTTIEVTTPEGKTLKATDSFSNKAQTVKKVPDKSTVKVTTTIDESKTFAGVSGSGYYVKGFSINGIFGGVLSQSEGKSHDSDVYTFEFTVNQELYNETKLEITPVYFLKDDSNCVYFYIENYDSAKQIWGNTPSCYVYYGSGTTTLEALGYYPGQPMVDYNGSIFTQIPKYIVSDGTQVDITGMTLNNYVWDDVHSAYNGKKQKEDNAQTYDYDDFVKIAESSVVNAENIIYRFKYNTHDNKPKDTLDTSDTDADGWEVFLDYQNYPTDIFGKKLGNEKLDYKDLSKVTGNEEYLSIISDGYQDNYIGQYATAWSIYNRAGNRVATIPSSALLYALGKSDSEMQTALASTSTPNDFLPGKKDRGKHWATFKTLYENYKGLYARINFEASIKDGKDYGNRLDGRWYYTKSQQDITGEIKIQYANTLDDYNKVGGFHDDKFANDQPSSIEGITTGASAYFTNPKDKVRKLETFADNTQDYKFEVNATSTAAYTFVGWYRLIDGDYKAINPSDMSSLTGAVTRNSDVTLVARYIKTPGGSMTFQHSLYEGENAGGGKATTEIQVVVKDRDDKSLYDSGRIPGTASIDKNMITELAKQPDLTVTVTLYTTTKNLYDFKGYYSAENTPVTKPFTDGFTKDVTGTRKEGLLTKSEYTFSFNDYYNNHKDTLIGDNAGTVYYNFYSDITSIKVPYKVQFSYFDRMGEQKYYNKAGYVDPENTSSYTFVEKNTETNGEGSKAVEVTLTDSFILTLAPYESNFTKNLTWNKTPDSNIAFDSSVSKSIASAVVSSTQSDRTIHLNVFRDNDTKEPTSRDNQNGAFVLYEKGGSAELPYGSVFYTKNDNGTYTYDITAPKTYTDESGNKLQFMYWEIYSDSECKNLVIKAYNSEGNFSYVAYDNCWIVPVYGESSTPVASVKEVSTSTQFMEVTRNQWTANNADSFTGFDADNMNTLDKADDFIKVKGEDKLYADFVLNFFYNGKQLSVFDPKSENVNVGVLIQRLDPDKNETSTGYITDLNHYANKYSKAELEQAKNDAINKINNKTSTIKSVKQPIDNSKLDNKNRLHYYTIFNNVKGNSDYVFRLYTYIQYTNARGEKVVQLSDPVYFTFYDIANKS